MGFLTKIKNAIEHNDYISLNLLLDNVDQDYYYYKYDVNLTNGLLESAFKTKHILIIIRIAKFFKKENCLYKYFNLYLELYHSNVDTNPYLANKLKKYIHKNIFNETFYLFLLEIFRYEERKLLNNNVMYNDKKINIFLDVQLIGNWYSRLIYTYVFNYDKYKHEFYYRGLYIKNKFYATINDLFIRYFNETYDHNDHIELYIDKYLHLLKHMYKMENCLKKSQYIVKISELEKILENKDFELLAAPYKNSCNEFSISERNGTFLVTYLYKTERDMFLADF